MKRARKIHRSILHSGTIFTQLVLFTVIISFIPIIFVGVVLFGKISRMVTEELVSSHYQLAAQYTSNLENSFYQYKDSLKQIANNTIVMDTLLGKTDYKNPYAMGTNVSIEINKSLHLDSAELRNCMVYSDIADNKIYGNRVTMMEGASKEIWYINHKALTQDYFIYSSVGKKTILSLIQKIIYLDVTNYKSKYIGFIKLDLYMDKLFSPTVNKKEENYSYDVIVLDSSNRTVYSSNPKYTAITKKISYKELSKNRINYYEDAMVCTGYENNYGLKLIFLFNNKQLANKKSEIERSTLPIFVIVLVVIIITAFIFTRGFSTRVARLIDKFKLAETGDLTLTEEIEGNDEITILDRQFSHMLIKLDRLIKKNYVQQLEKKESEFRNLQLQINPHFLYNTLETISSIAAVNKVFIICDLCEKLGENFRYSLGKNYGEFVTVMQELSHTKNYVYIQQTRFGNKFEVFYNVDKEAENYRILRFILQPIVENAIVHGLSKIVGQGTLEISISRKEEQLVIKIEDDGVGMSAERVEEISKYINDGNIEDKKRHSIGIRNVNQRIKLACGNEYGITIDSSENIGSCFTITLPLIQ
ncbi:sensor histidine kinase [Anaerocolumna chitinilytica]|uniref:sensor histidine kinase n=1 Tax=Anaerocolumna chitinilytica TaxID=1727145 RepID=UPI00162608E0|nr:sensor histidine kinase [Anaerocolumna chitinilytica]